VSAPFFYSASTGAPAEYAASAVRSFFYSASNGTDAIHTAPTGALSSIVLPMEQTPGTGSAVFFYSVGDGLTQTSASPTQPLSRPLP
jgi:hypothetical protein